MNKRRPIVAARKKTGKKKTAKKKPKKKTTKRKMPLAMER
jgi:hypothetical protein